MRSSLFLTLLSLASIAGKAQIATVDSKKVLQSVPAFAKIDTLIQEETQKYVQEFSKRRYRTQILLGVADSLQRLPAKNAGTEQAVETAQNAVKELQDYEAEANKKVGDYKELLIRPYLDKVNAAVKSVAVRLKYKQVMDVQQVPFVYTDSSTDITDAVIAALLKN